jgi:phage tail-like protein
MADEGYPPVSFCFVVSFAGESPDVDCSFSEVSGLSIEREELTLKQGGENRYSLRLPGHAKFSNLVLKRGLLKQRSPLATWCKETLESDLTQRIETKDIVVSLLDRSRKVLDSWAFAKAWPIKWNVSTFDASKSEIAVETLEFAYTYFTRSRMR